MPAAVLALVLMLWSGAIASSVAAETPQTAPAQTPGTKAHAKAKPAASPASPGARRLADEELVDLKKVEPTILIELRYATDRNVTGRAIYPPGAVCLVRKGVAERLRYAQHLLRQRGFGLKIWDAYRPAHAQRTLFDFARRPRYVADPEKFALHTWGAAVDATLVDLHGKDVPMPTDFDEFSPAATMHYRGTDPQVMKNLRLLQGAMGSAGFYGMRSEWWHFIARNWREYAPVKEPKTAAR